MNERFASASSIGYNTVRQDCAFTSQKSRKRRVRKGAYGIYNTMPAPVTNASFPSNRIFILLKFRRECLILWKLPLRFSRDNAIDTTLHYLLDTWSDADVHRLTHHAVRAASRSAICRPRVASGSSAQPQTSWTPLILPCRTDSVERTTWGLAFHRVHEQV